MRTLAQRLGSGTATLYRHFDNRAALIAHVVDHFIGGIELDAGRLAATDWREACRTVARTTFDALDRHRNLAPLLAERIPLGPNAMAQRELFIAFLLDKGFPPPAAVRVYTLLARYVLGFAIQLTDHSDADESRAAGAFGSSDPAAYPATAAVSGLLPVPLHEEFTFGLELILDGLEPLRTTA
jgi:TetR/AcrR family tetracycline transcriptional repressor